MSTPGGDSATGCLIVIVVVLIAAGLGGLFGWPWGMFAAAAMLLILLLFG